MPPYSRWMVSTSRETLGNAGKSCTASVMPTERSLIPLRSSGRGSVSVTPGVVATAYFLMRNCVPSCSAANGIVRSAPSGTMTRVSIPASAHSGSIGWISHSYNFLAWERYSRVLRFSRKFRNARISSVNTSAPTGTVFLTMPEGRLTRISKRSCRMMG